jgi:hypothetical protein
MTSSCSDSGEDVRVTLCKDLVLTRLGSSQQVTWTASEAQTRGYEHAAVRLRFSADGDDGEAVCYFDYDAVEDTALALSNPLDDYATATSRMTLNGEDLSRSELAGAVKDAMLTQGGGLLDRIIGLFR